MVGPPLDAVEVGVHSMLQALKRNPYALETVNLSLITFDAKARIIQPLSDVVSVAPPILSIKPGTALGAALTLLRESIERDLVKTTREVKGDWRPLVFILTDGSPTDDWRGPADRLKNAKSSLASIYAIGCGEEADFTILNQVADVCIHMASLSPESLAKLFVWLSASVQSMSSAPDDAIDLRKIPLEKGLELVDQADPPNRSSTADRRQYLHVMCCRTKRFYLLRYVQDPFNHGFVCQDAVPLPDDFFSEGAVKSPPIDANLLNGSAPCPYCHNEEWAQCGFCKHLFCFDPSSVGMKLTCPVCEMTLTMSLDGGGDFSVDGSQG
jgi:uncharacterized protein YegL